MKQKQPKPTDGKPESADTLAGNKLAEMEGKKAAEALDAASKINLEQFKTVTQYRLCPICRRDGCVLSGYYEVKVPV